jgi:hypothetical protein
MYRRLHTSAVIASYNLNSESCSYLEAWPWRLPGAKGLVLDIASMIKQPPQGSIRRNIGKSYFLDRKVGSSIRWFSISISIGVARTNIEPFIAPT